MPAPAITTRFGAAWLTGKPATATPAKSSRTVRRCITARVYALAITRTSLRWELHGRACSHGAVPAGGRSPPGFRVAGAGAVLGRGSVCHVPALDRHHRRRADACRSRRDRGADPAGERRRGGGARRVGD